MMGGVGSLATIVRCVMCVIRHRQILAAAKDGRALVATAPKPILQRIHELAGELQLG